MDSRFAIGIDLGTTNSSICYVDLEADSLTPKIFPIQQLIGPGETAAEPLLPSFAYLPARHELPDGALALPWDRQAPSSLPKDSVSPSHAVGRFARDQGAAVPERLVASAKSWLAHPGVNRRNRILPWGNDLGQQGLSPLQASYLFIHHMRQAWDHAFAPILDKDGSPCTMASQNVVITVPASFDETARTLTLEAATMAGLQHVTLLEEPLAAFYSWLGRHAKEWSECVPIGSKVLVVDVGGGTTDLSIIEIQAENTLRRTAVGDHLLLGGDNMDIALAHCAEEAWKSKLPQRQWAQLCHECRRIKEALLSDNAAKDSLEARISGSGSSLFAAAKTYRFDREQVESLILDGFLPRIPVDSPAPVRRRGIQEMGLPFAADPAITKHILQFLRQPDGFIRPTHLLFNGGAMLPALLRNRVLDTIADWCDGVRPVELPSFNLSLAVSEGAARYGLVRAGRSLRVKGGIARAYFLAIDNSDKLVCVMPRDTDEGIRQELTSCAFKLRTNQTVAFPLYSSATRLGDKLGDFVSKDDSLTALPPLCTAIKYGKSSAATEVTATLSSVLNETGLLEIWCDLPQSDLHFPLAFDLRATNAPTQDAGISIDQASLDAALGCVTTAFTTPSDLEGLMKRLEEILDCKRTEWNPLLLRKTADLLLAHPDWRTRSHEHESRWLNLCGFCMRPGFGAIGDDWRCAEAWKLWFKGCLHPGKTANLIQWHVFWRRIAAGLKPGQQAQAVSENMKKLLNAKGGNAIPPNDQVGAELWNATASMEQISPAKKLKLLQAILNGSRPNAASFWTIARLAARKPLKATQDCVIRAEQLLPLVETIRQRAIQAGIPQASLFALANATRLTGIRTADLPLNLRESIAQFLQDNKAPQDWVRLPLDIQEDNAELQDNLFGESLPLGLSL